MLIFDIYSSKILDQITVKGTHLTSKPGDKGISIMYSSVWQKRFGLASLCYSYCQTLVSITYTMTLRDGHKSDLWKLF